jgi:hypothetical protein
MDGANPTLKPVLTATLSNEPVQFTGFKLFYKNDIKKAPHHMLYPRGIIKI